MRPAARKKLLEHRRLVEIPELQVARDYLVSQGHQRAEDCDPWELVLWPAEELFGSMPGALKAGLGVEIVCLLREHIFGAVDPEVQYNELDEIIKAKVRRLTLQDIAWACAVQREAVGYLKRWGLDPARARTNIAAPGNVGSERDWFGIRGDGSQIVRGRGRRSNNSIGVRIDLPQEKALGVGSLAEMSAHLMAYKDPDPDPSAPWLVPPPGYSRREGRWYLRRPQELPSEKRP